MDLRNEVGIFLTFISNSIFVFFYKLESYPLFLDMISDPYPKINTGYISISYIQIELWIYILSRSISISTSSSLTAVIYGAKVLKCTNLQKIQVAGVLISP